MRASDLALTRGMRDTRATLEEWRRRPGRVLGEWTLLSVTVSCLLLLAVYVVAELTPPDPTPLLLYGIGRPGSAADVGLVLLRNSLVLALHALACVAGFLAKSSLPEIAASASGLSGLLHRRAGPPAIAFVVGATAFSLATQAYALGGAASSIAAQLGIPVGVLLVALAPHALPELVALFLPLAAWIIASRRGQWHQLLAATFVTVAMAAPVLVVSALIEVFVTPRLLLTLAA